ncbi:hypothetical protein FQZ97_469490 [compost metagenome]
MLNGAPLNSHPLNGLAFVSLQPEGPVIVLPPELPSEPGEIPAGIAYRWSVSLLLGGEQAADRLTRRMKIDREEGAAGVAEFSLYYPVGTPVPVDLDGVEVRIDLVSETGGETTQTRRYTGTAVEPAWDTVNRVMTITCSDQLQFRVEAMPVEAIDSLVGGWWTPDMFDAVDGRSRWDYARERLDSRPASLDVSVNGTLRVTSWFAGQPAIKFGPGSTIYQSISVELAQTRSATNRIELAVDYRYARLWQRNEGYTWAHPGTAGHEAIQGFCSWRLDSTELPDVPMIVSATESAGLVLLANAQYHRVPLTTPDPCGTGASWQNEYPDLLLGATWKGGRRWTQYITERYSIVLATAAGEQEGSQIIRRESTALEVEAAQAETWEDEAFTSGPSGATDLPDDARRAAVLTCAMQRGATAVIADHRGTTVSWQVPTPLALDADLVHTLELDDGTRARSKVRRIVDEFDFDTGIAVTTISLASMRGGGESDPLTVPAKPVVDAPGAGDVGHGAMPTQLGGRLESPAYDDELDGFAGNYSNTIPGLEQFPRRFTITASEIPAELRDERVVPLEVLYRIGIPNDLLEL